MVHVRRFVAAAVLVCLTLGVVAPVSAQAVPVSERDGVVTGQVTNGSDFPAGNPYPWVAGLFATQQDGWGDLICSGTLIAAEWVMTSAECVTSSEYPVSEENLRVVVGVRAFVDVPDDAWHDVAQVYVHPLWSAATRVADVALLRLATPATATPIEMVGNEALPVGTAARVAGWGMNQSPYSTGASSGALQWGDVEVLAGPTEPFCRDLNSSPGNGPVYRPDWMVCALGDDLIAPVDVCDDDGGAPLMVQVGGVWKLVGVAAWVGTCADFYEPGVYTRVAAALPWLQLQIANPTITACGVGGVNPFRDVRKDAHFFDATVCLASREVTAVSLERRYNPDGWVTRAQMAAFLWRISGEPVAAAGYTFRDDTQIPSWARGAADWLKEVGVTVNDPYRPRDVTTRAQMALFLWRLAGQPEATTSCGFRDVNESDASAAAVCWLKSSGITVGYGGDPSRFVPWGAVTRGQMASFLYRYGLHQGLWFNLG